MKDKIELGSMSIYDYIDKFDDIVELKKAARSLLKQDGEWLKEYEETIKLKENAIKNMERILNDYLTRNLKIESEVVELKKKMVEMELRWNLKDNLAVVSGKGKTIIIPRVPKPTDEEREFFRNELGDCSDI
jgi:hypothetical protein